MEAEEIRKLITEYGAIRNISYDQKYFTHNMPEFLKVAEISFEAGEVQGITKGVILGGKDLSLLNPSEIEILNAKAETYLGGVKQAGIKEMVEWGSEYCLHRQGKKGIQNMPKRCCEDCWQAKLKELGIQPASNPTGTGA